MLPLSPTEAIAPAFTRTRAILFQPLRVGRSWKLAFCAYLAFCGSLFIPFPVLFFLFPKPPDVDASFTYLLLAASTVFAVLMFAFYYLGSRMQFVLFDFVLVPDPLIAPLWRRHARRTWRWIGLKLAITLPISLVVLFPLAPLMNRLFSLLRSMPRPPAPPDPGLFTAIFSLYAVFGTAMLFLFLIASILSDFVLPSLALEELPIGQILRRFGLLCQQEPLNFIGYLGMRILLAIVGFVLQYAAMILVSILVGLILGAIALAGWTSLHTVLSRPLLITGGIALYLVFLFFALYIQLATFGALIIYLRAYSLFFLGGRYPLLGDILEPRPLPGPPLPPLAHPAEPWSST